MRPVGPAGTPHFSSQSRSPSPDASPSASPARSQELTGHSELRRSKAHRYEGSSSEGALPSRKPLARFAEGTADGSGVAVRVRSSSSDAEAINRHAQRLMQIHGPALPPHVQADLLAGTYYESKEVHKGLFQSSKKAQKEADVRMGHAVFDAYRAMVEEGHKPFKERKNFVQLSER